MTNRLPVNTPYLRNQRQFPTDNPQALQVELDKTYIDVSLAVNNRTVGLFPANQSAITGESWFTKGSTQGQQGQRQIFPFVAADLPNIPHRINVSQISSFCRIWGTLVDSGGVWYPLPFVSATAVANQVQIQVDSTNIVVTVGGGAPVPVRGIIVLEWLASP